MFTNDDEAEAEYSHSAQDAGCQGGADLWEESMWEHIDHHVPQGEGRGRVSPQAIQEHAVAGNSQHHKHQFRHVAWGEGEGPCVSKPGSGGRGVYLLCGVSGRAGQPWRGKGGGWLEI